MDKTPHQIAFEEQLMKDPVRAVPCQQCIHLREANSKIFAVGHLVCGWFDDRALPFLAPWALEKPSDAAMAISRKFVFGPHDPSLGVSPCPTFVAGKNTVAEA